MSKKEKSSSKKVKTKEDSKNQSKVSGSEDIRPILTIVNEKNQCEHSSGMLLELRFSNNDLKVISNDDSSNYFIPAAIATSPNSLIRSIKKLPEETSISIIGKPTFKSRNKYFPTLINKIDNGKRDIFFTMTHEDARQLDYSEIWNYGCSIKEFNIILDDEIDTLIDESDFFTPKVKKWTYEAYIRLGIAIERFKTSGAYVRVIAYIGKYKLFSKGDAEKAIGYASALSANEIRFVETYDMTHTFSASDIFKGLPSDPVKDGCITELKEKKYPLKVTVKQYCKLMNPQKRENDADTKVQWLNRNQVSYKVMYSNGKMYDSWLTNAEEAIIEFEENLPSFHRAKKPKELSEKCITCHNIRECMKQEIIN